MIMGCDRHWLEKPMVRIGLGGAWTIGHTINSADGSTGVLPRQVITTRETVTFWATLIGAVGTVLGTIFGGLALVK
jgi:phosphate/sulfate permease